MSKYGHSVNGVFEINEIPKAQDEEEENEDGSDEDQDDDASAKDSQKKDGQDQAQTTPDAEEERARQ